jgi:hypothetical protein
MKYVQITLICAVLIALISFTGCAKPPTDEMDKAVETVTRAENDIDAVTYGANSLTRARDALARMRAAADSKRYDAAKTAAEEATTAALRAIEEGQTGAARAKDEANSLLTELKPLIAETEQGINAAKSAKLPLDFNSIDREFKAAGENAEWAKSALSAGKYQESSDWSRTARSSLMGINQKLAVTVTETVRNK